MGMRLEFANFDLDFMSLSKAPLLFNDIDKDDPKYHNDNNPITRELGTTYVGDIIETMPSCNCGNITGRPNTGVICKRCDTVVMSPVERGFESDIWVEAPPTIVSFINPTFLIMLLNAFNFSKKFNFVHHLCNDSYHVKPTPEQSIKFEKLKADLGLKRGYNEFIKRFPDILDEMIRTNFDGKKRVVRLLKLKRLYNKYGSILFPRYLPMPSKRSVITEVSSKLRNPRNKMTALLNAAYTLYDATGPGITKVKRQREIFKGLVALCDYYETLDSDILSRKEGWYRKHIFGTRMTPSFRGVITSLSCVHEHDELWLPYGLAIATYRPYIMNKLLRQGYTVNDSERFIINAITAKSDQKDSHMMAILNELIEECGHKGFPVLFGRQPTLNLRSIQLLYVTRIKSDPLDNTISFSLLALRAPNADFDGDAMTGMPILCHDDWEKAKMLSPHSGINSLESPHKLNRNLELPDTDFSTLNNFMYGFE